MDDDSISQLAEINATLKDIKSALIVIAFFTAIIGFAAMKASGWWNLLGL